MAGDYTNIIEQAAKMLYEENDERFSDHFKRDCTVPGEVPVLIRWGIPWQGLSHADREAYREAIRINPPLEGRFEDHA